MTADNHAPQPSAENGTAANGSSANGQTRTKICVYCGASAGASPAHIEAARTLGRAMAASNIDLGESPGRKPRGAARRPHSYHRHPPATLIV
ncbi:hypothetical protein AUP68_14616 [Ilyonectria robusta]